MKHNQVRNTLFIENSIFSSNNKFENSFSEQTHTNFNYSYRNEALRLYCIIFIKTLHFLYFLADTHPKANNSQNNGKY